MDISFGKGNTQWQTQLDKRLHVFLLLFTVLLIKDILDLAWHLATRMKFGTCEQNWDLYGTISRLWPQLGPSPKFGTSLQALFLLFGFFLFRDQIFRNRDRDFFPRPNFFETETETLKYLAKVSNPRSFETEMSISDRGSILDSCFFPNLSIAC